MNFENVKNLIFLLQEIGVEIKPVKLDTSKVGGAKNTEEVEQAITDSIAIGFLKQQKNKLELTEIGQLWLDDNTIYSLHDDYAKYQNWDKNPELIDDPIEWTRLCKIYKK
jgi:hypothetical protein